MTMSVYTFVDCDACRKRVVFRFGSKDHARRELRRMGWTSSTHRDTCKDCVDARRAKVHAEYGSELKGERRDHG